jgi:hypothetical protein
MSDSGGPGGVSLAWERVAFRGQAVSSSAPRSTHRYPEGAGTPGAGRAVAG